MPQNFPEVWEDRVRELLTTQDQATWMEGIPELDVELAELGEENVINLALETFEPEVLLNNTTYPIEVQNHTDGSKTITLDKYQTKATKISHDAAIGSSYDKVDSTTRRHRIKINSVKFKKAAHAMSPQTHSADTPVISLPADYTAQDVYDAIVKLKGFYDAQECPEDGRRLVLANAHYNKLLEDRQLFANLLVDHNTGKVNGRIAGFKVYSYVSNPYFTAAGAKKAWGEAVTGTDKQATFSFYEGNVGKKEGTLTQYYDKPNTTTQAHLLNYRYYFITLPIRNKYIGAII